MAVITIGDGTGDYGAAAGNGLTHLTYKSVANDTGTLDTFRLWMNESCTVCKMGTFYISSTNCVSRDYENIGSVTSGSEQVFTGLNCDVTEGDLLGIYVNANLEVNATGGTGRRYVSGDKFGTSASYSLVANNKLAIYATGATAAAGNPYHYYLQQ
jgi:hypothetical protein